MSALQCDAAAIYDKRKDNLRFFLDNLPSHPCHVRPNFNLCTVCFKINHDIAKVCEVFLRFNQGIVESKVTDPLHVELARSIDFSPPPMVEADLPEELEKEFPLFEFAVPTAKKAVFDEEEVIEAEVLDAEVVEDDEPSPPPVIETPKPKPPAPVEEKTVKVKKAVKPVPKPKAPEAEQKPEAPKPEIKPPAAPPPVVPAPPKTEEKKAPEAPKAAEPAKPEAPSKSQPVKMIRKVKKDVKVGPQPPIMASKPMAVGPAKSTTTPGMTMAGPGDSPGPGPLPLGPRPDVTPPPPGPGPSPSPEPDDDYDEEDMAVLRSLNQDLDKKAPSKPMGPPPPRAEAKPTTPPGPPKLSKPGAIPPLFATLGKLETKKKPEE